MRRLMLGLLMLAAVASAASAATAPSGPPRPKVTTLGVSRYATVFQSCWGYASKRRCVATAGGVGHPSSTILWRPGATLTIDLRLAAQDVNISAEHVIDGAVVAGDSVRLALRRVDSDGRRWRVSLPARAAKSTDLVIYARHGDRGDLVADLGLRRRR